MIKVFLASENNGWNGSLFVDVLKGQIPFLEVYLDVLVNRLNRFRLELLWPFFTLFDNLPFSEPFFESSPALPLYE